MKTMLKITSFIGLALTLIPSFFVLAGEMDDADYKTLMLIGTIIWFASAPFRIFRDKKISDG